MNRIHATARAAIWATALVTLVTVPGPSAGAEGPQPPEGFQAIFNGKDLTGWDGPPGAWRVEDGALTWESTPENPLKDWPYLVWKGGEPGNFELRVDFKLSAEANSGVNFRSELSARWYVNGYQADMNGNGWLVGSIYAPRGFPKNLMSQRGEKSVISAEGKREAVSFGGGHGPLGKAYRTGQWNSMRLVCQDAVMTIYVNDQLMTELTDNDPRAPRKGVIALQMHQGPPMKIQFKNIYLKDLGSSSPQAGATPSVAGGDRKEKEIDLLASRSLGDWDFFLVDPKLRKEDVWSFNADGVLVCKGKPLGYLATKQDYKNFRLVVEWRWPGTPSNSGVQFRITGEPKGLPCCLEAQLKSGEAGDIYGLQGKVVQGQPLWEKDTNWGGHVRIVRKKVAAEKKPGEWNQYVITVIDDKIVLEVNGEEVNRATGADTTPGKIAFQSEGDVIEFRTARLLPLD